MSRLVLLILFSVLLTFKAGAQELWFEYGASFKTWKNLTTKFEVQHRFIDKQNMLNYKNCVELTMQYRLSPVFKISGSYRFANQSNINKELDKEGESGKQRYCMDLNIQLPLRNDNYKIENRSRYQISLKNKEEVKKFYRNKTTAELKIDKKTNFYLSDEIYYYISKEKIDMNRLSIGIDRELTKHILINLTFHIETEKEGRSLANNYILGSGIYLNF